MNKAIDAIETHEYIMDVLKNITSFVENERSANDEPIPYALTEKAKERYSDYPEMFDMLTAREAADYCGVSVATIYNWIKKGLPYSYKFTMAGPVKIFNTEDLDEKLKDY
jgi:excisionase family DNA binding protein